MKTNHLHYIVLLATIFLGCSCSEEIEKELTTGKTAVTIEVDGEEDADSRTVSFTGGTAYGEGLYDGKERPTVGAEASDGYEIDYFYGGPSDEPQKYNYTGSGSSVSYQVFLNGKDHKFKCKFKEKKRTLTLTANPTSGGTVTGGGTYKVKTNIPITAVAKSGYTFSGWTVTKGDAKIMNASSASTTVQLQSSNSTLQANFSKAGKTFYFSIRTGRGKLDVFDERGETTLLPSASEIVLNLSPDDENLERGGYLISPEAEGSEKTQASYVSTLSNYVAKLATNENICYVLTGNDFDFNLIDPEHPKLFAISNNYATESVISPVIAMVMSIASRSFSMENRVPFVFILDEMTTFKVRDFEKLPSVLREYGAAFLLLTQSGAKLEKLYSKL
ncbi:InlB B-repeat-containing protein, partial [Phocaeicola vulgatus]|uniref:InlB B-repeat-containing protein n=2 Tax=Phocaeicola vulgatus TaxID=821 RepID=UPI00070C3FE3